jgi:predicted Zn-dependent protease
MKVKGRFTAAGAFIMLLALGYIGLGVWGGIVNYHRWQGELGDQAITVPFATVFSPDYKPAAADKALAEDAIRHLELGGSRTHGGIGWNHLPKTLVRLSWLHAVAGNLPRAEQYLTQAIAEGKPGPDWIFGLARLYMLQGKPAMSGKELYERTLVQHPHLHDVRLALAQLELQTSNGLKAAELLQVLLADEKEPPLPYQYVRATELLIDCGYQNKALEAMQAAATRSPRVAIFQAGLATAQFYAADPAEAIETMKKALVLEPANIAFLDRLSQMYEAVGDPIQAGLAKQRAEQLMREQQGRSGPK